MTQTTWWITIDQRTPSGGLQRHHYISPGMRMDAAVEAAIRDAGLAHVEVGGFQITVEDHEPRFWKKEL